MNSIDSLQYFVPELIIIGTALLAIIYDLTPDSKHNNGTAYIALGGIALTLIAIFSAGLPSEFLFDGMIKIDGFSIYFKVIVLVTTAATIIFSGRARPPLNTLFTAQLLLVQCYLVYHSFSV